MQSESTKWAFAKALFARAKGAVVLPPAAQRLLSLLLSAAIFLYLADAVAEIGWGEVLAVLPANPIFYLLVAASYLTTPIIEYVIFRRWWPLRACSIAVFAKKRVLNEAVLGYSGDAYLYLWARKHLAARDLGAGPLAAVKDVAITSALAGNLATLLMLALAFLLGKGTTVQEAFSGASMRPIVGGFIFVISISLGILLFSRKVLSLSAKENFQLFLLHCLRLCLASALLLLAWIMALPAVAVGTWVVLGAFRMVVTRLPFIPNKELLFAAISVSLTGHAAPQVAALMAAAGALHFAGHLLSYLCATLTERSADPLLDAAPAATSGHA